MFKQSLTFAMSLVMLFTTSFSLTAQTTATGNDAARIKADVLKRGTGEKKRVRVTTLDGAKTNGYISRADDDSFTLTDSKSGQTTVILYSNVRQIKGRGGLGTGTIIALVAIGVGAAIAIGIAGTYCRNEGGC